MAGKNKRGGLGRGLDALFADAAPIYEIDLDPVEETAAGTSEEQDAKGSSGASGEKESTKAETINTSNRKENSVSHSTVIKRGQDENTRTGATGITDKDTDDSANDRVIYVDINDIRPNVDQPRKNFDEEKLKELAQSIEDNGVIQPLLVRRTGKGFELVAGERRWRAARIAGLRSVPCLVRDFDEQQNMIVAIVENMQREDLDPIEEAAGINEMMKRFGFTQEQVSKAIGKSRPYIANATRLLGLPAEIREMISTGQLSAAHGRTIAGVQNEKEQIKYAARTIRDGLSVRSLERLINKEKDPEVTARRHRRSGKTPEILAVEEEFRRLFGTKVNISGDGTTGKIEIEYYSLDELNRLIDILRTIEE